MLNSGEIDVISGFPSHLNTPQYAITTDPLFEVPLSILASKDSMLFENFEEFLQKRIASGEKNLLKSLLKETYPELTLLKSTNLPKVLDDLDLQLFDGFIGEKRFIDYHMHSSKNGMNYISRTLPIHYKIQIAIHVDLPHLHSAIQKTLNNLTTEQISGLTSPWLKATNQPIIKIWHLLIIITILILLVAFLTTKYRLVHSKISKLQKENQLSSAQLETITDAISAGLWIWHIAENQTIINSRYATMLGYEKEEIPPTFDGFINLIAPEDTTLMLSALKRHIDKVDPFFSVYIKLRHKDGSYRLIHSFGGVVAHRDDGSPQTLGGCHLLTNKEAPSTSEVFIDNIAGILTHNHYRAFVPLYFKRARQEFSGVMLVLFRLGFSEEAINPKEEALERFGTALFEHLPAPSGLCFYMGEGIFSSFYWNDDPSHAQIIAQELHTRLETVITSFSSSIYLHIGTAFMLLGSNVNEAIYTKMLILAQKTPWIIWYNLLTNLLPQKRDSTIFSYNLTKFKRHI